MPGRALAKNREVQRRGARTVTYRRRTRNGEPGPGAAQACAAKRRQPARRRAWGGTNCSRRAGGRARPRPPSPRGPLHPRARRAPHLGDPRRVPRPSLYYNPARGGAGIRPPPASRADGRERALRNLTANADGPEELTRAVCMQKKAATSLWGVEVSSNMSARNASSVQASPLRHMDMHSAHGRAADATSSTSSTTAWSP